MKKGISLLLSLILLLTCCAVPAAGEDDAADLAEYYLIDLTKAQQMDIPTEVSKALIISLDSEWFDKQDTPDPVFNWDFDTNGKNDITLKYYSDEEMSQIARLSGADDLKWTEPKKIPFSENAIDSADTTYHGVLIDLVKKYSVTVTNDGNGTGKASPEKGITGTEVILTAEPKDGYTFSEWDVVSGDVEVKDNKFTIKTKDVTVKATFKRKYTVTVTDDGHGTGTATPTSGVTGTEVTLTAEPKDGYTFSKWDVVSGDVEVKGNKFTIGTKNVTVKALFTEIPKPTEYSVTVKTEGSGKATADPVKGVEGTKVTLTQTADDGWQFKEWKIISGGITIDTNNQFEIKTANVEVTAVFEKIYAVSVKTEGSGKASADPVKGIAGTKVTLTQTADDGWQFKEWKVSPESITIGEDNTFTIGTADVEVTAVFEELPPPELVDISKAAISLSKTKYTYNGKACKPAVKAVTLDGVTIRADQYTVSYQDNKNAGKATVTVTGKGGYTGKASVQFTIAKAKQEFKKVTPTKKRYKASVLAKKAQTFQMNAMLKKGDGGITFSLSKSAKIKNVKVSKDGKVTLPRGIKEGEYTICVKATAAETTNYKKASKIVKIKISVTNK